MYLSSSALICARPAYWLSSSIFSLYHARSTECGRRDERYELQSSPFIANIEKMCVHIQSACLLYMYLKQNSCLKYRIVQLKCTIVELVSYLFCHCRLSLKLKTFKWTVAGILNIHCTTLSEFSRSIYTFRIDKVLVRFLIILVNKVLTLK